MRTLLVCLMVVAVSASAMAGGNPNVAAYLSFDGTGLYGPRLNPTPFQQDDVYLCLKNIDEGFVSMTVAVVPDAGVVTSLAWTVLIPGGLSLGDWTVGATVSGSGCVTDPIVVVASGNSYFMGNPGQIRIQDHADYPRWVVDCNDVVDFYCHEANVGVLMDPDPTGEDCGVVAVEDATWGGIKALYR